MWRVREGQQLAHRCWDEECALYNDLSGDTHLIERPTLELLLDLAARPQALAELAEAGYGDEAEIASVLRQLELLHLIDTSHA
jgi:PqqD family protein of HPr-rel-A system